MIRVKQWFQEQERWSWVVWVYRTVDGRKNDLVIYYVMTGDPIYPQETRRWASIFSWRTWWTLQRREIVRALVEWLKEKDEYNLGAGAT